jgi:hypothetical protein
MSGRSLPTDLVQSAGNVPEPPLAAPARNGESNLLQPGVAVSNSATVAASRLVAGYREQANNSQAPSSTPSILLGAPSAPAAKQVSPPESRQPENASRSSETQASAQPAIDPALFTKGLAAALAPQSKNLAFSLKMVESNSVARQAQQAQEPQEADRNQAANTQTKSEARTVEPTVASTGSRVASAPTPATAPVAATAAAATVNPVLSQATQTPQANAHADTQFFEPHQPANISTVAALHEARPVMPEAPRPVAASEILLQLGGKDQAAAIRVSDRAGTVNVSVHATDGDLRSSLRSNLGDLASQLTHQGWKTEVVKTGTSLTRGETSQDPQQDGQRSPGQQQSSSQGERQPQRDRRASSGQWQAEFEEQTSGNHLGQPGGTN